MPERTLPQNEIPHCVSYSELAPGKPFDPYTVLWPKQVQERILFHPTMKPTTMKLLLGLMHLMHGKNELVIAEPELARLLHMSERTVRSRLITLVKDGFVLPHIRPGKVTVLQLAYNVLFDTCPRWQPRQSLPHHPGNNGRTPRQNLPDLSLLIRTSTCSIGSSANGKLQAIDGSTPEALSTPAPAGNPHAERLPHFTIDKRTFGLQQCAVKGWSKLRPDQRDEHERSAKLRASDLISAAAKMNNTNPTIAQEGEREYNEAFDKLGAEGFEPKTPIKKKILP